MCRWERLRSSYARQGRAPSEAEAARASRWLLRDPGPARVSPSSADRRQLAGGLAGHQHPQLRGCRAQAGRAGRRLACLTSENRPAAAARSASTVPQAVVAFASVTPAGAASSVVSELVRNPVAHGAVPFGGGGSDRETEAQ